jgi:short-subunit dehydrogenase
MTERVWVVGASSGIGEAIAMEYASRHGALVLSARRADRLEEVAVAARARGAVAHVVPLDVSNSEEVGPAVERAWRALDGVHTVVLCSGVSQRSLAEETILDVDRRVMEVNYFGLVGVTKALLPHMIARREGRFIVISSIAGRVGTPLRSAYAASKHALHGFFDSLRAELHRYGISVSIACPGYINTSITLNSLVGDGSTYGRVDEALRNGMAVESCAQTIIRRAELGTEEFGVGRGKEMYALSLKRFAPGLLSRLLRDHTVS